MANQTSLEVLDKMTNLSVAVIKYCQSQSLPRPVVDQLTRSITSIGANFSEAQDASSKKDFINKIYIAKKEASECKYWLTIVSKLTSKTTEIEAFLEQTQGFMMMLQKIINSSNQNNRKLPMANSLRIANR